MALSDVLVAWKCLLLDKLHLSHDDSPLPENYDLIRKEYDSFLKRTNAVDLTDVYGMYERLRRDGDPEDPLGPVSGVSRGPLGAGSGIRLSRASFNTVFYSWDCFRTQMQLFEFLHGNSEACEGSETIPPCPATPSNRPRRCSSQVGNGFIYVARSHTGGQFDVLYRKITANRIKWSLILPAHHTV